LKSIDNNLIKQQGIFDKDIFSKMPNSAFQQGIFDKDIFSKMPNSAFIQ